MTRLELMELAEECSDVLTAMEDDLLQNIAEYLSEGRADIPTAQWKIQQLASLGKLDKANIRTIAEYSGIAADMEEIAMTRAALKAVGEMDEGFGKLAADGIIDGTAVPMEETALQAAAMYSKQAKDRLNKVNTVMRYFAKDIAAAAVYKTAEIVNKQQHLDTLNKAAGKVIMGAESRQTAVRQCIKEMSERGIPAFVDAGGRQWSPEAYINMDVRTTCSNAAHEAQFTRMDDYNIDLLETSSHAGARPKCSLDQGKIFSKSGKNKKYPAWSTSSYGEPDGILGINCGHFIYPYIEGVSVQRYFPYDKEENDKLYKQKQEQRRLEREVRSAKREVSMLNASGDKEGAKLAKERVKSRTAAYNDYCEKTGLPRKADRLTVQGYRAKAKEEKNALMAEIMPLKGSSVNFSNISQEKPMTKALKEEISKEYDQFTKTFGQIDTISSIGAMAYRGGTDYGGYNPNSREITLFGAGGDDGRAFLAKVAKAHKKAGEWSTSSPMHTARHEMGHALQLHMSINDKHFNRRMAEIREIYNKVNEEAMKDIGLLTNPTDADIIKARAKKLSSYGLVSLEEFISESVAEYQNGSPRATARSVVEILLKGYE